jgi:hypothetical protein
MIHPFAMMHARVHIRRGMLAGGATVSEAREGSHSVTADDLHATAVHKGVVIPAALYVASAVPGATAFGDGHILKAIADFFNSPAGQIILKALVAVLLAAIGL